MFIRSNTTVKCQISFWRENCSKSRIYKLINIEIFIFRILNSLAEVVATVEELRIPQEPGSDPALGGALHGGPVSVLLFLGDTVLPHRLLVVPGV